MNTHSPGAQRLAHWHLGCQVEAAPLIEAVSDREELEILVRLDSLASGPQIRIVFDAQVAYRNIDESYRDATWMEHAKNAVGFHRVENSRWLAWLRQEAAGILENVPLVHYAIFTEADCIDVASAFEPEVSIHPPGAACPGELKA